MILKASRIASINHARKMAAHLTKDENEVVQLWQTTEPGQSRESLENSLVDMQLLTKMTQGQRGIFHVAISPREHEQMSRKQWERSVAAIEQELGFTGQPRCLVYHEKDGRPHLHVCWSMVDQERGRLLDPKRDRPRLQQVAQALEREFGHEQTRRHANENTIEITEKDRLRASRTGKNPQARKELFLQIWNKTGTGPELIESLQAEGYQVAKGERARMVVVDRDGEIYNLVRQLPKQVKSKQVKDRLGDLVHDLPTVKQAQDRQRVVQERETAIEQTQGKENTVQASEEPLKRQKPENILTKLAKEQESGQTVAELFLAQEPDMTQDTERSRHDSRGKSQSPEDGKSLSQTQRRRKKRISANTLVGFMSQFVNLTEAERQQLQADVNARLKADQDNFDLRAKEALRQELLRELEERRERKRQLKRNRRRGLRP